MSSPAPDDIDISQDLDRQEREWKFERVGWAIMATLVLGNLLGLFGHGPLSKTTIGAPDAALQVLYQQRERYKAATFLRLRVDPLATDAPTRILLGREFTENVRITEVQPQAESVEAGPDNHIYEFNLRGEGSLVDIYFFYEPFTSGAVTTTVSLEGSVSYSFEQFFFP